MNQSSFQKGEDFEKFVENELFNQSEYELIHRTNSFEQNKDRYAQDTMKPDFKFRCKKTQKEFYVEAKFRSNFNNDQMLEILNLQHLERFKNIEKTEKLPVFMAIGYIGLPTEPNNISLIPLKELIFLKLYPSFLRKFNIEKSIVDSQILNLTGAEKIEQDAEVKEETLPPSKDKNSPNKKNVLPYVIGLAAIVVFLLLGFKVIHNNNIKEELKQKTSEYYALIDAGNIDQLEDYLSPTVQKWYSKSNVNFEQIKAETLIYQKKYPNTSTFIQWNTFEYIPMPNDEYKVSYNLIYKIISSGAQKDLTYHLKINVTWGEDLKIKSMIENKI